MLDSVPRSVDNWCLLFARCRREGVENRAPETVHDTFRLKPSGRNLKDGSSQRDSKGVAVTTKANAPRAESREP